MPVFQSDGTAVSSAAALKVVDKANVMAANLKYPLNGPVPPSILARPSAAAAPVFTCSNAITMP